MQKNRKKPSKKLFKWKFPAEENQQNIILSRKESNDSLTWDNIMLRFIGIL